MVELTPKGKILKMMTKKPLPLGEKEAIFLALICFLIREWKSVHIK